MELVSSELEVDDETQFVSLTISAPTPKLLAEALHRIAAGIEA